MSFAGFWPGHGPSVWARLRVLGLSVAFLSVSLAPGGPTRAASRLVKERPQAKVTKLSKGERNGESTRVTQGRKRKARAAETSLWIFRKAANVVPNQQGKVVLFGFRNDDGDTVSTQVGQLLEARGLEVVTGVRPVDSAEHYRDVATHLGLVGYVDGDVRGSAAKTKATVRLRSGFTGRHVLKTTFTESRPNLAREISENLWTKLGRAMARACEDATKPRKQSRTTLQINAGTPIETVPAQAK